MRSHLSALTTAALLFCPGKAGAEPGTVLRVSDARPCGEVVSFDGGWGCAPALDAGTLPAGWWVSQPQMTKLGAALTQKDNEIATLRHSNAQLLADAQACRETPCPEAPKAASGSGLTAFLLGLVAGLGGAFGVLYLVTR